MVMVHKTHHESSKKRAFNEKRKHEQKSFGFNIFMKASKCATHKPHFPSMGKGGKSSQLTMLCSCTNAPRIYKRGVENE